MKINVKRLRANLARALRNQIRRQAAVRSLPPAQLEIFGTAGNVAEKENFFGPNEDATYLAVPILRTQTNPGKVRPK